MAKKKILIRQKRFPFWVGSISRPEYLWLLLGFIFSLLATDGRWDVPLAAWLSPLFLLRFTRAKSPLIGFTGVWLASACAMLFFFYESQMLNPILTIAGLIFSFLLSLPYLIDRLLAPRLNPMSGLLVTLIFPLSRVALEYLTSFTPFGSIWSLAYTQYGDLPLLQLISITGIYGVSFLVAWFASVGNWIWEQHFTWPRIHGVMLLYSGLLGLVLLGGSIRLAFFLPSAKTVRIAGVSVPALLRQHALSNFSTPAQRSHVDLAKLRSVYATINNALLDQSQIEARAGAKIVVWPEAGALTLAEDEASFIERGKMLAWQEGIYLEMGYGVVQTTPSLHALHDRAVLLDPQGHVDWIYDKAYPIPGLESFAPGDGKVPITDTAYGRIANVICFDGDFPNLMRQGGSQGVDLMLVPSNDWRGIDPWHTQHAVFRAIENGYSLVRQTSNGLAMTVDYQGHVLAATDFFTTDQQTMIAFVPVKGVWTIYSVVGDLFAWLCLAGLLALGGSVIFTSLQSRLHASKLSSVSTADKHTVGAEV